VNRPLRLSLRAAAGLALARAAGAALGPRYGGDLSVGALTLPLSPVPGVARGAGEAMVALLAHETLLRIDSDGSLAPGLARDWIEAASGREHTLRLAPGIVFHDGKPVTPEDAGRSLRAFLRSGSPAGARLAETLEGGTAFRSGSTEDVAGIHVTDDELTLRFTDSFGAALAPLAAPAAAVVAGSGEGAGPFVPTTSVPGRSVVLTAFAGHVRGRPYLDRVQVLAVADHAALDVELQTRRIALAVGSGALGPPTATLLLILDTARSPFDRPARRASLAAALGRADLVSRVLPEAGSARCLLSSVLLPVRAPAAATSPPPPAGGGAPIELVVSTEVPPLASQRLVAYLIEMGYKATVRAAAPGRVLDAPGHARLVLWSPEVPEPELGLRELSALAPQSAEVRDALTAVARETNPQRRRAHLASAEAALRRTSVLVPLASVPALARAASGLHGVGVDSAGRVRLEDAWLEP
jgi:ABC-type transport system substrate-binding protein